jgi:hypothetical protein
MRLTVKRRPVCDRLAAAGETGFGPPRNRRSAAAVMQSQVRCYSLLSRKAPARGDSNGTSNVFPAAG